LTASRDKAEGEEEDRLQGGPLLRSGRNEERDMKLPLRVSAILSNRGREGGGGKLKVVMVLVCFVMIRFERMGRLSNHGRQRTPKMIKYSQFTAYAQPALFSM